MAEARLIVRRKEGKWKLAKLTDNDSVRAIDPLIVGAVPEDRPDSVLVKDVPALVVPGLVLVEDPYPVVWELERAVGLATWVDEVLYSDNDVDTDSAPVEDRGEILELAAAPVLRVAVCSSVLNVEEPGLC
jgi:hypothetical protein